jgi:hypothetical protein
MNTRVWRQDICGSRETDKRQTCRATQRARPTPSLSHVESRGWVLVGHGPERGLSQSRDSDSACGAMVFTTCTIPLHVDQIFILWLIVPEPWLLQPLTFFAVTPTLFVRRESTIQATIRLGLGYDVHGDSVEDEQSA